MKKILLAIFLAFSLAIPVHAVTGVPNSTDWVATGPSGGGSFPMIIPDHHVSGKFYLITDVGYPYVTTNSGNTWTWLIDSSTSGFDLTLVACIIQSKNNANLMYAMGGGQSWERKIIKSVDGGKHWTVSSTAYAANRPTNGKVLAFDPTDDDTVYVGSSTGTLARTTDGGATWTNLATSVFGGTNTIRWIYVDPTGDKVFMGNKQYSGGGFGVKVYDVSDQTVSSVTLAPTTVSAYTDYKNLTTDYGTYIDGSAVENFCVSTGVQIACTNNPENGASATWTYTSDATTPGSSSSTARYINRFGVSRSSGGTIKFVVFILFNQNDSSSGSFGRYSSDGGSTWATSTYSRNTTDNPTFFGTDGMRPESIVPDPNNSDVFLVSSSPSVFRSDNGGSTFSEKVKGAQILVSHDVKIAPDGTIIVCSMDMGCQKSTDNGTTWINMLPKFPWSESGIPYPGGHYWKCITLGTAEDWAAGNGRIIVTSNYWYDRKPRIHRSADNGATWTTITSGLPLGALWGDCVWGTSGCYFRALDKSGDETVIYAAMDGASITSQGDGGLFKSIDDGLTWTRVWSSPSAIYNALAVDPTDTTAQMLMFGTATSAYGSGYNAYHKAQISESAELTGSGQTRTGALNTLSNTIIPKYTTFTSSGGEIFTDAATAGILVSNLGGSGTINYSTRAYSLTFVSTPSSTTVSYGTVGFVGDSFGPSNVNFDATYDSNGVPYLGGSFGGAVVYKSVPTIYGDGSGTYGTWRLVYKVGSGGMIADALLVDPRNNNRVFFAVVNGEGGSSTRGNRVYVTTDANNVGSSTWYDITGDLPSMDGCNALAINYNEGTQGYLYCASQSAGLLKLDLADTPASVAGKTTISFPSSNIDNIPVSREWAQAGFGGSGVFPLILSDLTIAGRLYAVSDVAGAFITKDAGAQWDFMNDGVRSFLGASIAQSESNPDIMYMLGTKITKSTNRGRTWQNVGDYSGLRPRVHKSIAIDRSNPDLVYVGLTNGNIVKTINGGTSWEVYDNPFGSGQSITFLYINPAGTYLLAGGRDANGMMLYDLSDDSSSPVTLTGTNATYNWDYDTYKISSTEYVCVGAGWRIACTDDISSGSWTYTSDGLSDPLYIISRLNATYLSTSNLRFIFHGRRTDTPYLTTYQMRSIDGGSSWTDIHTNVTTNTTVNPPAVWNTFGELGSVEDITCDNNDENVCYITSATIMKSIDGGINWVEHVKGGMNVVVTDIAVSPGTTPRIFMSGMDIGVLYSDDNGDHWTSAIPHTSNGDPQGFAVAGHYWQVETLGTASDWNAGNGRVVVTSSYWADLIPRVAYSSDNGITWTITQSGLPTTLLNSSTGASDPNRAAWGIGYPRGLAKCPSNDAVLYLSIDGYSATENGGIFRSADYGHTWTRTTQPSGWKVYNAIDVDPTDATCNTVVFSEWFASTGATNKTYRTTNGGSTWTSQTSSNYGTYEMAFASNGKAYMTGLYVNPSVHFSNDGITWSLMTQLNSTSQVADAILTDPNNANRIFVGVNDGIDTGPGTGEGKGTGAVYVTANAQDANPTWVNITGNLPALTGVQELAISTYQGHDWLFITTDGSGVFRLKLDDVVPTTLSGVSFN